MTSQQEIALMQTIRGKWHAEIDQAAALTGVPADFLAALIANESGGNPSAKRFERGVLASLWEVLQGRSAAFGSIGAQDLRLYILSGEMAPVVGGPDNTIAYFDAAVHRAMQRLDSLATSWGLTQIMGYEAIPFHVEVATLADPGFGLVASGRMLKDFAARNNLSLTSDYVMLFDCWNTGRPHAPTADPQYIPNAVERVALYRELGEEPAPKAVSGD